MAFFPPPNLVPISVFTLTLQVLRHLSIQNYKYSVFDQDTPTHTLYPHPYHINTSSTTILRGSQSLRDRNTIFSVLMLIPKFEILLQL